MGSSSSTPHFTVEGTEIKGNKGACPRRTAASELLALEPRSLDFSLSVSLLFAFLKRTSEVIFGEVLSQV